MKTQTSADVISTIGQTDFREHVSRDKLSEYLGRNTIPSIPFGTTGGQLLVGACPTATAKSSNQLSPAEWQTQTQNTVGLTLTKLTITPAKAVTIPSKVLRVFFTIGLLYRKGTDDTINDSLFAGYFLAINPFDLSYWLIQDFYPVNDYGIEQPITELRTFGNTKTSLARISNGKTLLGNTMEPLQLDPQMTFQFTKDELKIGGVLTEDEYQKAKSDFGSAGGASS